MLCLKTEIIWVGVPQFSYNWNYVQHFIKSVLTRLQIQIYVCCGPDKARWWQCSLLISFFLFLGMLFHRVILMSGSALSPWAVVTDPTKTTLEVAKAFNCSTTTTSEGDASSNSRTLLQCLRAVPLYKLMKASSRPSSPFNPIWGPSYDGVVVHSFKHRMRDYLERMARYNLIFGVASADALIFGLNNKELEYGLELEGRNRILSEFVSNNYKLHQREIFSAIVNEYTDWQSVTHHPVSIRDKTLEALTDAQYVAPVVETGDYHSSLNAKSWFYVFDYQTRNSHFKQVTNPFSTKREIASKQWGKAASKSHDTF